MQANKPHGNTGKQNALGNRGPAGLRNAAKPNPKQSLTIRLPPNLIERARSTGNASAYVEGLIRADMPNV